MILSLYRLSFERRLLIRKTGTRVTAVNIQHLTYNIQLGPFLELPIKHNTTTVPLYNITIKSTKMKPELIIPIETLSIPKSKTAKVVKYFIDKYRVEL